VPCPSVSAGDPPLVSAGAEFTSMLSLYGVALPVRIGVAFPLQGDPHSTRLYVLGGAGF
jgi:hypothetical protein